MSRSELITLLGPPDGRADDPEIEWDMGSVPGYDDNALRFKLKDDKVVGFSVFRM